MAQRQRKGAPAQGGGGGNGMFYAVLGVIALGGVIAIGYALLGGGGAAVTEPIDLEVTDARALYEQATPVLLGQEDAPAKIVEFADFQCPGCAAFSLQERPKIMPFIESGLAQLVYYDYPLGGGHVHSFLAARAARCAGAQELEGEESAYWPYHDKLYQEQPQWSAQREVVGQFVEYAEEVGLNVREFERCLRSDRFADVVTANRMVGDQLGVRSTPTILLNNRRVTGRFINDMGNELVRQLQEMQAARAASADG